MTEAPQSIEYRMLDAYGARIWRWPAGRLQGIVRLVTSATFRRRFADERALDQAIGRAVPHLPSGERFERRLLAAMGIDPTSKQRNAFSPASAGGLVTASLIAGLLIGGQFGPDMVGEATFAGLTESAWTVVEDDIAFEEFG